jgi:hypothetical protein
MTARRGAAAACILVASFALSACDEKAIEFARRTKQILDQRSQQLAAKIAAERAAYNASAAHAAEDHRALIDSSLRNARTERSGSLAADYDEGRKPVSQWRRDLADYARIDYEANRGLVTDDLDADSRYVQIFAELTIEQDKVEALSKLLAALTKKPSLKDDVDALGSLAGDTKTAFDKLVCADLKTRKGAADDAGKAAAKAYDAQKCDDVLKAK